MQTMHDTHKRRYRCHKDHHNHQLHRGRPPDRRQGAQKGPSAHAMPSGGPCSDVNSDSEEPLDGKTVQVCNRGDMPPTTINRKEHAPPPPPLCQHSHSQGVVHLCVMEPLPSVHPTTQEMRRRHEATPKVEEDTEGIPGHIARRPQGPSVVLMRATATRPKRRPTVQHRRNGVKVCCPPPHPWGMRPPLLTPVSRETPRVVQKRVTLIVWNNQAVTHQQPQPHDATAAKTIGRHQWHPPIPLSTGPKGPGAAHKRAVPIAQRPTACVTTTNTHHSAQPPPQFRGANATPLNHPPPGCNAQASHTSAQHRSCETTN